MKQIILGIAVAVLTFLTVACFTHAQSGTFLTTSSPNKTYTVELTGNKYRPSVSGVDHQARFNLFKNGQLLVSNAYVDSYDHWDSDFAEMYPEHRWVSDSILRFGHDVAKAEKSPDSLSISNNTNKTVKYLKIIVGDMLFVFEMPPKSKLKLQVPHQSWISWVWADGEFSDAQRPKGNGANFFHKNELNEPLRYCLSVSEAAIKVESPIMDGYIGSGTSENINIPKAANCDL